MGCATGISKCILIIVNMIFMLPSLTFIALGVFIAVSANDLFRILFSVLDQIKDSEQVKQQLEVLLQQEGLIRASGFALIGFGVFLLLLSFLGCAGAVSESKCMLVTYSVFLFLLGAAKVALLIVIFTSETTFKTEVNKGLKTLQDTSFISILDIVGNSNADKTAVTYIVNVVQVALDCCGAIEVADIADSSSWKNSNRNWTTGEEMVIPATCCPIKPEFKSNLILKQQWRNITNFLENEECPVTKDDMHSTVCYDALFNYIRPFYITVIGSVIGLIVIEILLIIFSLCIACSSSDEKIYSRSNRAHKI